MSIVIVHVTPVLLIECLEHTFVDFWLTCWHFYSDSDSDDSDDMDFLLWDGVVCYNVVLVYEMKWCKETLLSFPTLNNPKDNGFKAVWSCFFVSLAVVVVIELWCELCLKVYMWVAIQYQGRLCGLFNSGSAYLLHVFPFAGTKAQFM